MKINGRKIGPSEPPYIVAEISGNHCGSLENAILLINAAKNAGADAVKIQAYAPDTITIDCDLPDFIIKDGPWKGRKLYELYQKAHTPLEWIPTLFKTAKGAGITLFASVFDETALEILEKQNCPAYKIASMEITDIPLIKAVAKTGKPMIISTGMASDPEITEASLAGAEPGNRAFLHCVSGYPTKVEEANLWDIGNSGAGVVFGLSDHTRGKEVAIAAVARGACIIEKHLMLHYEHGVPEDADFSMWPEDFASMALACKTIWKACQRSATPSQDSSRQLRRSLYVVKDMKAGERFTHENVRSIRPAYGLPPALLSEVMTMGAACDIKRGTALSHSHLAPIDPNHESWDMMWARRYYKSQIGQGGMDE